MKSDFVGRKDGFNFICKADFIRASPGFHRAMRDFIENLGVLFLTLTSILLRLVTFRQQKREAVGPNVIKIATLGRWGSLFYWYGEGLEPIYMQPAGWIDMVAKRFFV